MRFFLFLLLLSGCGKETIYTYPPVPASRASTDVQEKVDAELERLESEFSDLDVTVNLRRLPVVISPLPFAVMGRCQYKDRSKGAYIVLSPELFREENTSLRVDDHLFEEDFVRVLIHEIGHCYFGRTHELPSFLESPGHVFELIVQGSSVIFDKIPKSVMPAESSYRMPKSLRRYYLAELARRARLHDPVMLKSYTEYHMISTGAERAAP